MSMTLNQSAKVTLPTDDVILIEREFDAPPHLVWRATTEAELVKRWFHANRATVVHAEIDLRVGGTWRYVSELPDGSSFAFSGEYSEIEPERRIVTTEVFEPYPDNGSVNTVTYEPVGDGRTKLTVHCRYDSQQTRDAVIASGMEAGMQDAYDLLEECARSLA